MIIKTELVKYCNVLGLNLGQAEIDYIQHLFLIFFSKHSGNSYIFKGGTALQKGYGLNRFSIDLDFTQVHENNINEIINKISSDISDFGYKTEVEEKKTIGKTFILKINGPLYIGTKMSICNLKIEISQRESILLKPQFKEIMPRYNDLQPYTIMIMDEEEILAEKVRAIMTRNKPRDVFDLGFILKRGAKFQLEFINKKLEYYKEQFEMKRFIDKLKEKENIWEKEMRNYVKDVPEFKTILKEITNAINNNKDKYK
ncbi:nucleotidyl transferase AbiEii/AbiGii toxin family protein [Candidatus Woesearchaeota archaeon]|nr:nucleotidyl transferase AbiEii/AbiGii toxin family protein [Candidatus Woesearchaeota archaeon]